MIKIFTGWSNKGGSTISFIALTNALNAAGYETKLYGPHEWHLDKCNSGLLDNNVISSVTKDDILIYHFLQLPTRPNAKRVILSCHEKNLFLVGKVNKYWDEVVFLNQRHRLYHKEYFGKFSIIPNLKESLKISDKTGLDMIAGVIGTFDENKQTHISIIRALKDGCEKIFLFGEPSNPYYEKFVKPLISNRVIEKGFMSDKQSMYDMIGRVYHSSISEVATLVKDECESTGTKFFGNDATDTIIPSLSNDEIIKAWVKVLGL